MTDYGEIQTEADFADVMFTDAEFKEVRKLYDASPGKDLNLSNAEIAKIHEMLASYRNAGNAEKISAASDAMRAILVGRYNEYRAKGLAGVESYQRSRRKRVDVGAAPQLSA